MRQKDDLLESIKALVGVNIIVLEKNSISQPLQGVVVEILNRVADVVEQEYGDVLLTGECAKATRDLYIRACMNSPLLSFEQKQVILEFASQAEAALSMGEDGVAYLAQLRRAFREVVGEDIDESVWNQDGFLNQLLGEE